MLKFWEATTDRNPWKNRDWEFPRAKRWSLNRSGVDCSSPGRIVRNTQNNKNSIIVFNGKKVTSRKKRKTDKAITKLLESKILYLVLLVLAFMYLYLDSRVINVPRWIYQLEFVVSFLALTGVSLARYFKFRDYYRRQFKDAIFLIAFSLFLVLLLFLGRAVLRIPVAAYLTYVAKDSPIEQVECEIVNVSTLKIDKITYRFNKESYWRYISLNGLSRTQILKNYKVLLSARLSTYGAYLIEDFQMVEHDSLP